MQIEVSIDNGMGTNTEKVDVVDDLCMDTVDQWEKLDDDEKRQVVTDYWESQGYPEIWWEE